MDSSSKAAALISAAKKQYGELEDITMQIDRRDGTISGLRNGEALSPEETERIGRIGKAARRMRDRAAETEVASAARHGAWGFPPRPSPRPRRRRRRNW